MASIAICGCGRSSAPDPEKAARARVGYVEAPAVADRVSSIQGLTSKQLSIALQSNASGNVMISPWSLVKVLELLRPGASGDGIKEFDQLLGSGDKSGEQIRAIDHSLQDLQSAGVFCSADGAWMSQNAELKPEFKKGLLDATVTFEQTSFPDPGLSQINGFVDDRTYGKISKLFERIDPLTILVVVNALYFNDKWATPFEPGQNIKDQFEQASGSKVPVTLMHRFGEFHYVESKTCQKVRIGYQSGLAMTIVLPKEGTSLEACLSEAPVLSHSANEREGNVMIPRWENSFSLDLNPVLQKMGLKSIYQSGALENIAPGTVVSQAIQKTWIRVDEAGTEAAAATAIAMEGAANIADKDGPFEFKANRPFLYFIHTPVGAILFAGAVREPRP